MHFCVTLLVENGKIRESRGKMSERVVTIMVDLYQTQLDLEREQVTLGIARYRKSEEQEDLTKLPPGQRMTRVVLSSIIPPIHAYLTTRGRAKGWEVRERLQDLTAEELAYLAARSVISSLGDARKRTLQSLAMEVSHSVTDHIEYKRFKKYFPEQCFMEERECQTQARARGHLHG
jgi:hypothetical protein